MTDEFILSPEGLVIVQGSSKGTQPKYYENGYWYKVDNVGYEGVAEELISKLLSCSNIKNYVKYEVCRINGRDGCRSANFLEAGESFVSFQRLFDIFNGRELSAEIRMIDNVKDRIEFVKDFIKEKTNLDCSEYLSQILTLDMLTLNTDRHLNNLGIIVNEKNGTYKTAPVFDNGNSLLSDWGRFQENTIEKNIELVYGQPFSSSLERQALEAGLGLTLDYSRLEKLLAEEKESRALKVLRYQLARYRNVIPDAKLF